MFDLDSILGNKENTSITMYFHETIFVNRLMTEISDLERQNDLGILANGDIDL